MAKTDAKTARKVARVMHAFMEGKLKSGGTGRRVKNPKQAVAIGLSEARGAGGKVPPAPRKSARKPARKPPAG